MTETAPKPSAFDLDAALGELEPKPLTYKRERFELPAEFPTKALVPFLRDDLGLVDVLTEAYKESPENADFDDLVIAVLDKAPKMPFKLIEAAREAFETLLGGPDEYARFDALNPSIPAYLVIARGVVSEYGVGLTDFFGSDESSDTDGEDSKPTSPASTTDETPTSATPSDTPDTPTSSG